VKRRPWRKENLNKRKFDS